MLTRRCTVLSIALIAAPLSAFGAVPTPKPITLAINGTSLSVQPPPRIIHGVLFVPVRHVFSALGLPFDRAGSLVRTSVGDRTVLMRLNCACAVVNGDEVRLEAAPVEISGVFFAPLGFFTAALGAQAQYSSRRREVEISSSTVGRASDDAVTLSNGREYMGVVQAIDEDSVPPSITVTHGVSVKTVRIRNEPPVLINDVVANTLTPGTMDDVHVGDFAKIVVLKDGSVSRIVAAFASRRGTIAAIAGNEIVLNDGHVVKPSAVTALSLNEEGAQVADLHVGDDVTVRYNLDTSEVREIIATRPFTGSPPPPGPVAIASLTVNADYPLRPGDGFDVVMHGTPGGTATFDVGPYFTGLTLSEHTAGTYSAHFVVPRGANFRAAPIFGHLVVGGTSAPRAVSEAVVSAASTPPGIGDVAPDDGATVNDRQPSIYATFAANAVPVNTSSIQIVVNGRDVTSSAQRAAGFVEYRPAVEFDEGTVRVTVRVSDLAGNGSEKSWTFRIKARQ